MTVIMTWPGLVSLVRKNQIIIGRFDSAHRVFSTSAKGGGSRDDVTAFYNHKSCEPAGHDSETMRYLAMNADTLHLNRCESHDLDPKRTVSLGTAASMHCLGVAERQFRELKVAAICTAGVEGNAGRAGDAATIYETIDGYEQISIIEQPKVGTIVTILLMNKPFTHGALGRSLMTATEAKTALLNDLVIPSRYSQGLATGTGTDQFFVACPTDGDFEREGTGKHSIAGQLIAEVVYDAIEQALVMQNGLTRSSRRSLIAQLNRFNVNEKKLRAVIANHLSPELRTLCDANFIGIDRDPHVVGVIAGLSEVLDQCSSQILPSHCLGDYLFHYAIMLASSVSAGQLSLGDAHRLLNENCIFSSDSSLEAILGYAIALGYQYRWPDHKPNGLLS